MAKNLLIVESPAKAKTIERILGEDFEVKSCYGHIRDLERADMGIDLNNNINQIYCSEDKVKIVKVKSIAKNRRGLARTDEDWKEKPSAGIFARFCLTPNDQTYCIS
jgi:DNA topoisomerase-1